MKRHEKFAFSFFTEGRDKGLCMEHSADAMAADLFNRGIALTSHVFVGLKANVPGITLRTDGLNADVTGDPSGFYEVTDLFRHIAHDIGFGGVTEEAIDKGRDVHIDDVPVF